MANVRKPLRRINQNVPGDLYDRLAATAVREDRTKSAVLIRALEAYIGVSERTAQQRREARESARCHEHSPEQQLRRPKHNH
jgi:hypothetical protein